MDLLKSLSLPFFSQSSSSVEHLIWSLGHQIFAFLLRKERQPSRTLGPWSSHSPDDRWGSLARWREETDAP